MTDYKQLCAELVAAWDDLPWHYDWKGNLIGLADGCQLDDSAVERARAVLAKPEPEGPTRGEAVAVYSEVMATHECPTLGDMAEHFARAVLARWGNHPGCPDGSLQPVPVSERLPGPKDCDNAERVWCWSWAIGTWRLSRINQSIHSHWLPAHALPLPS